MTKNVGMPLHHFEARDLVSSFVIVFGLRPTPVPCGESCDWRPPPLQSKNMCGIVGYVGRAQAAPILLDGLRRLEYRGYDSAGVAIVNGKQIETRKCAGRI